MLERAITFECGGEDLLGILHEPSATAGDVGVLFIVGGPQYRVGSHRQFVTLARELSKAGFPVLRFDYRGMGDSSGEARTFESVDQDVGAAVDVFLSEVANLRRVAIFGLCDAASAAMMYAPGDPRVSALVLANPWARTAAGQATAVVRHYYWQRLFQRSFWAKAVRGGISVTESVRDFARSVRSALVVSRSPVEDETKGDYLDRMARGLRAFRGPSLFILSGRDLTAQEFATMCRKSPVWRRLASAPGVQFREMPEADHTFSSTAAERTLADEVICWLSSTAAR